MIGFKHKNLFSPVFILALAVLILSACSSRVAREGDSGQAAVVPPQAPAQELGKPQSVTAGAEHEPLTADLLYDVLLGEIAGQRGELDISGKSYLDAARESNDPRIAERALKITLYGQQSEDALEAARRWVSLAPENLEAHQALAALALRNGEQQEAQDEFEYLLAHGGQGDADPYKPVLALLAREPDKERALAVMEQLSAQRPDDADACFAHARLAIHADQWASAEQQVNRCLVLRPDWTEALILRAQIQIKQDKGEQARRDLDEALQRNPGDAALRTAYARLLVDLDDYDAARAQYHELMQQQPDNGAVVYALALLSLENGQYDEAGGLFERMVELDFQPQQAWYYLGAIEEEQKHYRKALQWYDKVEEGSDHWIEVQIRMARLEAEAGDVGDARERLRSLRLGQPTQAQRLYLVEGEILAGIGQYEEAFGLYTEYLASQPDDLDILYARSLVAERLDRLDIAESDLQTILKREPDNVRALNALGYTLANRTTRYHEAFGYIEKAYKQTPNDPAVMDSMGWVLFRLGRYSDARTLLQKAYDETGDAEIAAHLGEVMWVMGDKQLARALWEDVRKKSPEDPVLEDTVRRLDR